MTNKSYYSYLPFFPAIFLIVKTFFDTVFYGVNPQLNTLFLKVLVLLVVGFVVLTKINQKKHANMPYYFWSED